MLIIPVPEGLNWRRPPPVTLLLLLLNVAVFFLYQSGDDARAERALKTYLDSSLPAVELPLYHEHLRVTAPERAKQLQPAFDAAGVDSPVRPLAAATVLANMEADASFAKARRAAEASSPQAASLNADRVRFEGLWGRQSAQRFGFVPVAHDAITWVTSQFLHGDLMHLLGNMVFLFIVGVAVETALGSGWTLVLYLVGGVLANALFYAFNPDSAVPLVGASGAISGLMGLFTVVFGLRQVRFFYWVVVVFGFRSLPGLVVLPVWILHEIFQNIVDKDSRVAYVAHAGGLIGGALIGLLVVGRLRRDRVQAFHAERATEVSGQASHAKARALVARLDFKAASAAFGQLALRNPHDEALLGEWHAVAKSEPASEAFHRVVGLMMALPRPSKAFEAQQVGVLGDYLGRARPGSRLDAATLARLGVRMAHRKEVGLTERIAELLFKLAPRDPSLPEMWALLLETHSHQSLEAESRTKAMRYEALIGAQRRATAAR